MGFVDLFRAKWKHSNVDVRLRAVRALDGGDEGPLEAVARTDADEHVRRVAIKKLSNARLLLEIARTLESASLREAAQDRAAELLLAEAIAEREPAGPLAALGLLAAPRDFVQVALRAARAEVRRAAVARVSESKLLADLAVRAEDEEVQLAALARLDDAALLAQVASAAGSRRIRDAATRKLPAEPTSSASVARSKAAAPPVDKARAAQLLALCVAAESAARRKDGAAELDELRKAWDDLDGDSAKPALRQRFSAALELHAQRQRAHEDELLRRERAKEAAARAAAQAAPPKPVPAAKPAPAVEPEPAPPPAPAPPSAEDTEREAARLAALAVEAERVAAAAAARRAAADERARADRAQLLAALAAGADKLEAAAAGDRRKALDHALRDAQALEARSRRADDDEVSALRQRFAAARDKAATRLADLVEAERWKDWANLPKLEQICQEAEALAEVLLTVEDKRHAQKIMTELRERWKSSTGAPSDRQKALWERFQKAGELVHERTREWVAAQVQAEVEAAARKDELCQKVEALIESTEWKETSERIIALQAEWKQAGHVAGNKGEALWNRFRGACDRFFARREEADKTQDAEREINLTRKEALCAQVEALATSTEWRRTADLIKGCQAEWTSIGEVPRGKGGPLWKRFRTACDAFFAARTAAFTQEDALRAENLAKKQKLCEQVEALAASATPETRDALVEQVKTLQQEWEAIGHVPREAQDAVRRRFRAACDAFLPAAVAPQPQPQPQSERAPAPPAGISGFTNRIPLEKVLAELAVKKSEET